MLSAHENAGQLRSSVSLGLVGPLLLAASASWFWKVTEVVREPYLDEVFHVRQAQQYCAGNFHVWDPKITTPPGLYLTSYVAHSISGRCDITALRLTNLALLAGGILVLSYHAQSVVIAAPSRAHVALNICLFPPLFFFSALYYTDIASTVAVLLSHVLLRDAWERQHKPRPSAFNLILTAIVALSFRQTNIFWVAVFPAGLALVYGLQATREKTDQPLSTSSSSFGDVIRSSRTQSRYYTLPVSDAFFEDYLKTGISLAIVAISNLKVTTRIVFPYIVVLAIFAMFVILNGGVVLGDKSNHVATVHFAQMLYIWPYFTFFSFPLMYPKLLSLLPRHTLLQHVQRSLSKDRLPRPRLLLALAVMAVVTAIVRFNTIIHPFTRADNRHYTFYAFRYFLLRHPLQKYVYAPLYFFLAHCTLACLQGPSPDASSQIGTSFVLIWFLSTALSLVTAPLVEPRYFILPWLFWRLHVHSTPAPSVTGSSSSRSRCRSQASPPSPQAENPSFAPAPTDREKSSTAATGERLTSLGGIWAVLPHRHVRLYLETIWYLTINAVTGYMFLYRGFEWPQEPGKVQRFMW